jgi:hypothetical protein
VHCIAGLDLPEPPAVAHLEARYDAPTAVLSAANAEAVVRDFVDRRDELAELDDFSTIVRALVRFDEEVTTRSEGDATLVEVKGVPIRADAVITITGDCPGWRDEPPVVDALELTVVVERSRLTPIAWGTVEGCRFELSRGELSARVQLSAELVGYVPTLLSEDEGPRIIYLGYALTELAINDAALPARSGDFRRVGTRLELLLPVPGGTVVAYAAHDGSAIGVRAANGEWTCFPLDRRCESVPSPADSFPY